MIHSIQILHNVDWNPLLTQTGFVLQLLETYKISLNKFDNLRQSRQIKLSRVSIIKLKL
jgi:hypothetical protein